MGSSFLSILLGIALGARHALEPDHLAAVTVLAAESPTGKRGALLGLFWGVGHTVALLVVGLVLALLSTAMPARWSDCFEFGVAVMLVFLGVRAVVRAVRQGRTGPAARHDHGGAAHVHAGPHNHVHLGPWTMATRPLVVGLVHGLAGSGAMTAFVVAELPTVSARLGFLALFGVGSVLGMGALSGLAGWPLSRLTRNPDTARLVFASAGVLSAALGVVWGWPIALRLLA